MKKQGRPSKLTAEMQQQICDLIRRGNFIETISHFVGIDKSTYYSWLKRASRQGEELYVGFALAVSKAMAEAEIRDLQNIMSAAKTDWQASAWRLERALPNRFGKPGAVTSRHE